TYTEPGEYFPRVNISCSGGCDGAQLSGSDTVNVNVIGLVKTINGLEGEDKKNGNFKINEPIDIVADVLGDDNDIITIEILNAERIVVGTATLTGGETFVFETGEIGIYTIKAAASDPDEEYENIEFEPWKIFIHNDYVLDLRVFIPEDHAPDPLGGLANVAFECRFLVDEINSVSRNTTFEGEQRGFVNNNAENVPSRAFYSVEFDIEGNISSENMGFDETREYEANALSDGDINSQDDDGIVNDCVLLDQRGRASVNSGSHIITNISKEVDIITITLDLSGDNPVVISPNFDIDLTITLDTTTNMYEVTGNHDCFPAYELWISNNQLVDHMPDNHTGGLIFNCLNSVPFLGDKVNVSRSGFLQ
ncbi:MAG: hypothetical protein ACRENO_03170, partial [Thermodesulfobacteriota bacterium]